jgi:integrase/recombinase XerD
VNGYGRRDVVLLSLLYDTGARVQEIIDLTVGDVRLDSPAQVILHGKGRKTRAVPLMSSTVGPLLCTTCDSCKMGGRPV